MIEDSKYKNEYTAQDFERYYTGKMSSLEMHELEKAAMEDPFLSDALEGYRYSSAPVQDMEYLKAQLQSKTEQGKVMPLSSSRFNKNRFLKIAALFILLAGCGWAVYQFGFNNHENETALAKENNKQLPPDSAYTTKLLVTTDSNNNEESTLQSSTANANTETPIRTSGNANDSRITLSAQNKHTGESNLATANQNKEKEEDKDLALAETKSFDKTGRAKASASLSQPPVNYKKDVEKSIAGNIASAQQSVAAPVTASKDSAGPSVVSGYGMQRKKEQSENVIVMHPDTNMKVTEVVIAKGKKDSTARRVHIAFEEAEPINGTEDFDNYVAENFQLPVDEQWQKNTSGEVKLSFDVNEAGEAINIKVEKSLCTECDKEAIRILKEGPKWVKKKQDKKGKLSIKF